MEFLKGVLPLLSVRRETDFWFQMNTRFLSLLIVLSAASLLAFFEYLALEYFLFWRFFWYDIMMHILGGIVIGTTYAWGARYVIPTAWRRTFLKLGAALLFTIAIGVLWEVFEYMLDIAGSRFLPYPADTMKDMANDIIGGILGYFLIKRTAHE